MKLVAAGAKILFSRVGQVLANAAVVLVVAKTLGPEGQGHYSLTVALCMLLAALLGGGMGLAAVPPLRQNKVPVSRMVKAQLVWAGGMILVLALAAWWSTGQNPADVLHRRLGWFQGLGYLAALAAAGFLGFDIFSYDLLARGRLVVGAAVNGSRAFIHLVLILVLSLAGTLTFGRSVGVFALAQMAGMLAMLVVLLKDIRRPVPVDPAVSIRELIGQSGVPDNDPDEIPADLGSRSLVGLILYNLKHGWLGQISAVAYFLLLRLDQGLLEYYRGAAEVGIYSIAVYMGEMLWLLPGALTPLLVHSSAGHASDPERDRTAARAVRLGIILTLAAGVPLFLLAEPLLALLAGGEYQASGLALRALLPGIVAFAPGVVLAGDFIGRGKPHWNTQASVLTVVVNLIAGVMLIPKHGPVGAAWASSIAYACGSAVMLIRFRQITRMSLRGLILGRP
jgi:O-antigen/teichoic acid export membrane protein